MGNDTLDPLYASKEHHHQRIQEIRAEQIKTIRVSGVDQDLIELKKNGYVL